MSNNPEQQVNQEMIEQARRQVNRLAEEIAQLSEMEMEPSEYYGEFLQRVLAAIAAPSGAVWIRTAQGNLQLQYQIRMREVGLDDIENGRQIHDELLRQTVMRGQPAMLAPNSGLGQPEDGAAAGNPTAFVTLIAPIMVERQVAGLVEVWQDPNRGPDAQRGFLQFLIRMAGLASSYTRNHQLRQMSTQQQVWSQLETFAKSVHSSLNPTEVAYQVANEGRRLIECDRVSVGLREGGKCVVRAISGADVVEKRSNLVIRMRQLFDEVLKWDEKLVYTGAKDESLPPKVLRALDYYLEESNSKMLVVEPLRDTREEKRRRPSRSVLMMEAFEPSVTPDQLSARMDVVAKHATSALYNAWEYRKMPFRFLWAPMAQIQEGLGGKTKAIVLLVTFAVVALITLMVVVPYPLKMDATGQLMPKKRGYIYSPRDGHVVKIALDLKSGDPVKRTKNIIWMHSNDLEKEIRQLNTEIAIAHRDKQAREHQLNTSSDKLDQASKAQLEADVLKARVTYEAKLKQREAILNRINADASQPGLFRLRPPMSGKLLTADFRQALINKYIKPNEPLLLIGDVPDGAPNAKYWEIELKVPQKHIGQVLAAYTLLDVDELDVDFLLVSQPTQVFKGKLARVDIASQATPDRTDNNEAEAVVLAKVRLSPKYDADGVPDIPKSYQMPPHLLLTGTEAHTRIRCGNHAMGYSLFYGVWEFFYEKVVFFF